MHCEKCGHSLTAESSQELKSRVVANSENLVSCQPYTRKSVYLSFFECPPSTSRFVVHGSLSEMRSEEQDEDTAHTPHVKTYM